MTNNRSFDATTSVAYVVDDLTDAVVAFVAKMDIDCSMDVAAVVIVGVAVAVDCNVDMEIFADTLDCCSKEHYYRNCNTDWNHPLAL